MKTASVQVGASSAKGTSLTKNDGKNAMCHPSKYVKMIPVHTSNKSSGNDKNPQVSIEKAPIWIKSAQMATP